MRDRGTPYREREWLRSRYEDREMSLREIAAEAGCSLRTIARWMAQHGIRTRNNVEALRMRDIEGGRNPNWRGGATFCRCGARISSTSRSCARCRDRAGANNSNFRGVATIMVLVRQWSLDHWRPAVFERDGFTCQHCGDSRGGNLHAHHLSPLAEIVRRLRSEWLHPLDTAEDRLRLVRHLVQHPEVASIRNGVTLCEACHRAAHYAS